MTPGYRTCQEILSRVKRLAEWTKQFKPEQMHLTMDKKDRGFLIQHQDASMELGATYYFEKLEYMGLELK